MRTLIILSLLAVPLCTGCQTNQGGSATQYEQLMEPVSDRQMTGGVLVFTFEPVNRETQVVIDVTTNLSSVDPLFHVVEGNVDYEEYLTMNPADVINVPYTRTSNRMVGKFVPYSLGTFTLFVLDNSTLQGTYSVNVYQRTL